jgi:alanine racemase
VIRQTVATVDLGAIAANCRAVIDMVTREGAAAGRVTPPGVIAVIKANAYGHGAVPVAAALEAAGVAMLACADIEEGVLLRQAGIRAPIRCAQRE